MKLISTLFVLGAFALGVNAQWELPATFEYSGEDTIWNVFANNDLPGPLEIVENPDVGGVNTSEWCLQVTIDPAATKWVGAWTNSYGTGIMRYSKDTTDMQIMAYSDVQHVIGVRGQNPVNTDYAQYGFIATDTLTKTNEWQLLTLEYPDTLINSYPDTSVEYYVMTLFFDLNENREQGSTLLVDNLQWITTPATSVQDQSRLELSIYPNPADDMLMVKSPAIRSISVTNLVGQRVKTVTLQSVEYHALDVSTLEPGLYFLTVDSEKGTRSSKFIKN